MRYNLQGVTAVNDNEQLDKLAADDAGEFKFRRVPLVERWLRSGEATKEMHDAAALYGSKYDEMVRGPDRTLVRIATSGRGGQEAHLVKRLDNSDEIVRIHRRLGKIAAGVVECVIGEEETLKVYCQREATNSRPVSFDEAKGRLKAGLAMLAVIFGTGDQEAA